MNDLSVAEGHVHICCDLIGKLCDDTGVSMIVYKVIKFIISSMRQFLFFPPPLLNLAS